MALDLKKSAEAFDRALNSPEGQKYIADLKLKHKIADGRRKKMHNFLRVADPLKLVAIEKRFLEWEEKYQNRMYDTKHVETQSNIFSTLVDVFEKHGKETDGFVDTTFMRKIAAIENSNISKEEKIKQAITYMRTRSTRKREMFLSSVIAYGKYTLKRYDGQGCFYKIYRGKKQVW